MSLLTTHAEIEELAGGRARQTIGLKPIAYRLNGNLTRILNRIGNTGDPNLPLGVSELAQFRVRNKLSGNAPVVHFGKGQSHVRFTPLNTANVNGIVAGNIISFPGAWNNADLRLSIAGHILHKDIPLRTGHPGTFSFRLDSHQNFNVDTLSSEEFLVLPPILLGPQMQSIPLSWAKSVQGGKTVLTVTLPPGNYAGWTLDPTLVLQPDGTDGKDTWIYSAQTNWNNGAGGGFWIGDSSSAAGARRALMQFNLLSLPDSATISSTAFNIVNVLDRSNNARTVRVYRLKVSWVEGTNNEADDTPATGATWTRRDTTNNWASAGAFGAADCEQTDIGSYNFAADEPLGVISFALTPTTKSALDLGNGWLIKADTESQDGYAFASSDNATAADRPTLTVVYTVPAGALYRRFMMTR